MQQSESIKEIATALCKAQGEMRCAPKDATNPHFKSRYADLASIWDTIRAPLTSNGLSVLQSVLQTEGGIAVQTQLNHRSGEWFRMDPCPIPVDKQNAQGAGSAITYGKRYSLAAAVGIVADDDDDGNEASQRPPQVRQATPPKHDPPALNAKDAKLVSTFLDILKEATTPEAYEAAVAMLRNPDSGVSKAENVQQVKREIFEAMKKHPLYVPQQGNQAA